MYTVIYLQEVMMDDRDYQLTMMEKELARLQEELKRLTKLVEDEVETQE